MVAASISPALLERHAHVLWLDRDDGGSGRLRGSSRAFCSVPFSLEDSAGAGHASTTPGELLAGAHTASFVASLAHLLAARGTPGRELGADETCDVETDGRGGREIAALHLRVFGRAAGLDAATFAACAEQALASCPVSRALSADLPITLEVNLTA